MQNLRVTGVENGALLASTESGDAFRIPIDDALHAYLRRASAIPSTGRRLSPREIQTQIRSGMSAEDVASITGADLEYVRRFEGPVLAEREYVVESALRVPVHTAIETDPLEGGGTFGAVLRERLADLGAVGERWASWKEQGGGWIVKLSFTADSIDHDARWQFEPRKHTLVPLNHEAITLSQQEDTTRALIPRLRAVSSPDGEHGRFDSGAFAVDAAETAGATAVAAADPGDSAGEPARTGQTADLLEALRRRRGEREAAAFDDGSADDGSAGDGGYDGLGFGGDPRSGAAEARSGSFSAHPSTGSIRLVDVPLDDLGLDDEPRQPARSTARRGRASMPSWDEIVFGARSDDDPA